MPGIATFPGAFKECGELDDGACFGKVTDYCAKTGKITNRTEGFDGPISQKNITDEPENAYYTKDGRPLKALAANWEDYTNFDEREYDEEY